MALDAQCGSSLLKYQKHVAPSPMQLLRLQVELKLSIGGKIDDRNEVLKRNLNSGKCFFTFKFHSMYVPLWRYRGRDELVFLLGDVPRPTLIYPKHQRMGSSPAPSGSGSQYQCIFLCRQMQLTVYFSPSSLARILFLSMESFKNYILQNEAYFTPLKIHFIPKLDIHFPMNVSINAYSRHLTVDTQSF